MVNNRQIRKPALEKIEEHFRMSFTNVITKLHWTEKRSINELSKRCNVSRDTFATYAKYFGLTLRSIQDANKINPPIGKRNGMYGLNKNNCDICKKKSEQMKKNNPANNNATRIAMSKTLSDFFKKNPLSQELLFKAILDDLKIKYIFQHPINRYVVDFFIPNITLCIEIDSTDKWGKTRRNKAKIKDSFLESLGFKVLRINKKLLRNKSDIHQILNTNNVI